MALLHAFDTAITLYPSILPQGGPGESFAIHGQ
jgi:hypothetical protein